MRTKVKILALRDKKEVRLDVLEREKIRLIKKGYIFKEYLDNGRRNSYAIFEAPAEKVITDKIYSYFKFIIIALGIFAIFFMKDDAPRQASTNTELTDEYFHRKIAKDAGADYDKMQSTLQKNIELLKNNKE